MDQLQRFSVLDAERRSQSLMPLDDFIETVFQRRRIQWTASRYPIGRLYAEFPGVI